MAKQWDIEALRETYVKSLYGRRLGFDVDDTLVGPKGYRIPSENWSSDSTFATTDDSLTAFGVSIVGTSLSSGTSSVSSACQQIAAPEVGVEKFIVNISTAVITIGTTLNSAFFSSTAGSTAVYMTMQGKGAVHLIGLTTAVYQVLTPGNTASTNLKFI